MGMMKFQLLPYIIPCYLKRSFEGRVWREIFAASNRLTGLVTLLKLQWQIVDWSSFLDAVFSRCGLFLNAIIMRARRGAVSEIIAIRNGLFSWVVGGLTAAWVAPGTGWISVELQTIHWFSQSRIRPRPAPG